MFCFSSITHTAFWWTNKALLLKCHYSLCLCLFSCPAVRVRLENRVRTVFGVQINANEKVLRKHTKHWTARTLYFFFVLDVCFLFWFHWALKHLQAHLQNIVLSFLFSFFVVYFFFSGSCTSSCGKHYLLSDSSAVDPHTHCAFNAATSLGVVTGCHCEIAFKAEALQKIFFSAILKVFLHLPFSPHWNVFSCSFFIFFIGDNYLCTCC